MTQLKSSHLPILKGILLLVIAGSINAANAVEFFGSYSKQRFTEEHYYVYKLDIWGEGEKLFGFYATYAGLQGDPVREMHSWRIAGTLSGKSVSLKGEKVVFGFTGSLSEAGLSGRWTDSMTEGIDLTLQKQAATEIEPALLKASLGTYDDWGRWAEQYLDSKDVSNKQLLQEFSGCARGDGQACLSAGNSANLRGNKERARELYDAGCELNNPYACLFAGKVDRARELLESRCTGEATMQNNFACKTLGGMEEKSGNLVKAKDWYRKGCNDSIPLVCPEFIRLEGTE